VQAEAIKWREGTYRGVILPPRTCLGISGEKERCRDNGYHICLVFEWASVRVVDLVRELVVTVGSPQHSTSWKIGNCQVKEFFSQPFRVLGKILFGAAKEPFTSSSVIFACFE